MQVQRTAVLLNDTTVDHHHGCRLVVGQIHRLASHAGISITKTIPAHFDWRHDPSIRDILSSTDIVIVNGEGTIHHSAKSAEPLLAAAEIAASRNIPSVLINSSWHSNSTTFAQMARHFNLVSVRESASASELADAGIESRVLPDLSLLTTLTKREKPSGIGYSDCVLRKPTAELAKVGWQLGAKPLNILYGRRTLRSIRGLAIRCRNRKNESTCLNYPESLRFAFDMTVSQCPKTETFLRKLSSFELVITGRFHIMMLCMALRVPFIVAPSNTRKNEAALADAGLCTWRHANTPRDINQQLIDRAIKWESREKESLDAHLMRAQQESSMLFEEIAHFL
jgi:polysaccharide pyruvyl transferase WcaK-like protein